MDGPLSLFKLTHRYGTSIAKVLPSIVQAEEWELKGSLVRTSELGKRIYQLKLSSSEVGDRVRPTTLIEEDGEIAFDSLVEEKFYSDFQALRSGWNIIREPSPLIVGRHVFIPDFCFEKQGIKVFMEIVGFWTPRYLESKIKKLGQLQDVDIIIAADEKLACDKLKRIRGQVIFYKRNVPLRPVLKYLKDHERTLLIREIQSLDLDKLRLEGSIVELHMIAQQYGVSDEALRRKLEGVEVKGYTFVGELFVSNSKLREIEAKIAALTKPSLNQAIRVIEEEGVEKPYGILSALNYGIRWNGLDMNNSSIYKKQS